MPVGNSDRGVGLWAGQVMFGFDNSNEHVDWWHERVPNSGEAYDHKGVMLSNIFTPSITIGISNYINISIAQILGHRHMFWGRKESSIHHRSEGTGGDFINAVGGIAGDSKIMIRYLLTNTGKGFGSRIFVGGGAAFPSKNTLTSDPFYLTNKAEMGEHRHFSMSDGCVKAIGETQLYLKRHANPVFIGGAILVQSPVKENKYGYRSSTLYDLSLTAISKEILAFKGSLNFNFGLLHTTNGYWNGIIEPNSRATIVTIGLGVLKNTDFGVVNIGISKPSFIYGGFSGTDTEVDSEVSAWRINIGFRRMLNYVIPWLDPLKNL
ncbi:MAG: hypothetical protein CMG63_03225 [Candidatus Marinimicrobia bacterium]|nr:hypothetical protein [Candidatus Neomarinimicrobiota bacterium]